MKKKLKVPDAFTTIFMITVIVAAFTWFVPAGTYEYEDPNAQRLSPIPGTYQSVESNPQGIADVLRAPITGLYDTIDIMAFVLVMGGFLGLVMKTGAINAGIGAILKKIQGQVYALIPILMLLFGLGGTIFGMSEETVAFYLLVIPIFLAAGFDAILGMAVVFLGSGIGCMASTINPFSVGIASGLAGISLGDGLFLRFLLFILLEGIGTVFLVVYAKKIRNHPEKSLVYNLKEESQGYFDKMKPDDCGELTNKHKLVLLVFVLSFVIMIIGVIPWADKFGVTIFEDAFAAMADIPFLGSFLGNLLPFGQWWFQEMTLLFLLASIVLRFLWGFDGQGFYEVFLNGARDLLGAALIIGITRGISIIMNDGGMTASLLHWGETNLSSLGGPAFAICSYLFYLPLSFLVPSTSALASLSMPIMVPLGDFANVERSVTVVIYALSNGLMNLFTPTNGVLMCALAMTKIPYTTFLRFVGKLVAILALVSLAVLIIAVLI